MTCEMRLSRVVGLPVIHAGKLLGHVEQVLPDGEGKHLDGLVIRRGLRGARWASRESVGVLGEVSVILARPPERSRKAGEGAAALVKDESGLTLGRVTDMWLDAGTMAVTALEISLGPLEDVRRGRLRVEAWSLCPGGDGSPQVVVPRRAWETASGMGKEVRG